MAQVHLGDIVLINLAGRLADGATFITTEGKEPLQLTAGGEKGLKALTQAVLGMQDGEKRTVTVPPEQGFGLREPDLQRRVPRKALPKDARVGDQFVSHEGNRRFKIWVRELGEDFAVVDENHPLAGQTLTFDIELVSVQKHEVSP